MGILSLGRGAAPVGLDIGSSTFRLAQLKPTSDKPILINYATQKTPDGLISEGEIIDADGVSKALAQLWREKKISEKRVVVGVANQKVVVRVVEMPLMTEDELRSAIRFQANDYIPIPIDEAIIDFQIISERESDRQDKMMDVLVVAARKDMVESTIAAVEGAGLRPIIVDVSSLAFARAVLTDVEESFLKEEAGDAGATTLINISSSLTDIVVLEDNIPRFTRISSMGGDAFTDALVNQLGIPFSEAEELKTKIGLRSDGDESSLPEIDPSISMYKETVNNVLEQEMDRFIAEIRRSLDYYLVQSARAKRIEKIIVTGGGAKLRNILRYMKERLQVEVEPGHPLHSVQVARKLSEAGVDSDELSMAICLGLAMRGVEG